MNIGHPRYVAESKCSAFQIGSAIGQEFLKMLESSVRSGNRAVQPIRVKPICKVDTELAQPFILVRLLKRLGGIGWWRRAGAG